LHSALLILSALQDLTSMLAVFAKYWQLFPIKKTLPVPEVPLAIGRNV
jgi:hypothetical protein